MAVQQTSPAEQNTEPLLFLKGWIADYHNYTLLPETSLAP